MSRSSAAAARGDTGFAGRVVAPAVTLVLLFMLTVVSMRAVPGASSGSRITILVGFVLLASSVAGKLAVSVGLPRITGFLVVGMLAGPSVLGVLPTESVDQLRLIDDFALALIAMLAGGELKVAALRPRAKSIVWTTLCVTLVVWVGVGATTLLVRPLIAPLAALPIESALAVALLLGIWAANSSPDLTVAVVEETGAKGPLTDVILGVTIVKDVVVIVLFTLTLALVAPLVDSARAFSPEVLTDLAREVGGAVVAGGILGWLFSLYLGGEGDRPRSPAAVFLFAYVLVVLADHLHVELLLAAVAAGFVIENLSPAGDRMIQGIVSVSVVFFAFFFTIAGAGLDLGAVRRFGVGALALLVARTFFTWLGARWGTRIAGSSDLVKEQAWRGLLSQGGVTLGLILLIGNEYPELGGWLAALGMAVILGNILAGPVVLKQALQSADGGEEEE